MKTSNQRIRIGFLGLDTSHVPVFTKMLNDPNHPHHVPRGHVVAGYPGGSADFPLSINRVGGFTEELKRDWGVKMLDTPQAVAEAADLIFITTCDGRAHRALFEQIVGFGKPVFIDKPLATSSVDARAMIDLAKQHNIALMSCSSLRYAQGLNEALANGRGDIRSCDIFGPMNEEPTQPGWFWYGCHSVEMMIAAMGVGMKDVRCLRNIDNDHLTATWHDGRTASIHGLRNAHSKFGITLHRTDGPSTIDASAGRPYYAGLLSAIMSTLPENRSDVSADEMLHIVQVIEAANESRNTNGAAVSIPPLD